MTDKFEKATGRSIEAWMEFMRSRADGATGLDDLSHQEMVRRAVEGGASEWWAQGIAVEVERAIGRREVGQTVSGSVNAGASRTVPGEWGIVFEKFVSFMAQGGPDLLPGELSAGPTTTATARWRYWRVSFADGSTAVLDCSDAPSGEAAKTRLSMSHDKLPSMADRAPMKEHWRRTLTLFAEELK